MRLSSKHTKQNTLAILQLQHLYERIPYAWQNILDPPRRTLHDIEPRTEPPVKKPEWLWQCLKEHLVRPVA